MNKEKVNDKSNFGDIRGVEVIVMSVDVFSR
jgi:hypothetical protein